MHDCAQNHSLHTTGKQSLYFYIKPKTDTPQDFERSLEVSGPSRITTAPACPRSDFRMAVCIVSLCMDLSLSRHSISKRHSTYVDSDLLPVPVNMLIFDGW
jgi:hypothetical protein